MILIAAKIKFYDESKTVVQTHENNRRQTNK